MCVLLFRRNLVRLKGVSRELLELITSNLLLGLNKKKFSELKFLELKLEFFLAVGLGSSLTFFMEWNQVAFIPLFTSTIHSPYNHICVLDTTLGVLNT